MERRRASLAATVAAVGGAVALWGLYFAAPPLAFSEVMSRVKDARTMHFRWTRWGKTAEGWLKRPDKLRLEYTDGSCEISNGEVSWEIDEGGTTATKRPSVWYLVARRQGSDVFDCLADFDGSGAYSGYFSEGPVDRIRRQGRTFDVYRMELDWRGRKTRHEALVDVQTHRLESIRGEREEDGRWTTRTLLTVLAYDLDIPDDRFQFRPAEGIKVVVSDETCGDAVGPGSGEGSTLSGRIVWASNGHPVSDVLVTAYTGERVDGKARHSARTSTDRDGRWQLRGFPKGRIHIPGTCWGPDWPAVPQFAANVGSLQYPKIDVDGTSAYTALDFKIYKATELLARFTIEVRDEDGKPVKGACASLASETGRGSTGIAAGPDKQLTGPDGKFDSDTVWPTRNPVRLCVGKFRRSSSEETPYVPAGVTTEPFIVEPGKRYDYDLVLPFQRELNVRIVDRIGQPIQGLAVSVADERGRHVYPFPDARNSRRYLLTDAAGAVRLRHLAPGRKVLIGVKRLPPDFQEGHALTALASACIGRTVPKGRDPTEMEISFLDSAIRAEVTCHLPDGVKVQWVSCLVGTGPCGQTPPAFLPLFLATFAGKDDGPLVLDGLPAGDVRLAATLARKKGDRFTLETLIHAEPGKTYLLKLTADKLEMTGTRDYKR